MSIVWTILKIIGILLLVLLGFLLAVILLVLFVPIRYRAQGEYREDIAATARVTWLLHLLSVHVAFAEKTFSYQVKVCGIRLLPKKEKAGAPESAEAAGQADEAAENVKGTEAGTPEAVAGTGTEVLETAAENVTETVAEVPAGTSETAAGTAAETGTDTPTAAPEAVSDAAEADAGKTEAAESTAEKKSLPEKLRVLVEGLLEKLRAVCAKIKDIRKQIGWYRELLDREETKRSVRLVWGELKKMLKHIRPRKLYADFHIGTGDPASTGQVLALHGMLYPLLGEHVRLVPDFEEKHIEGEFQLKGHITICMLLICTLRVILNKEIRQLIQRLRKKEEA